MEVIRTLKVNASAGKMWKILGEDYDKVGEWTSEIEQSTPNPDLPVGEGRVCSTPGFGDVKETLTNFNEQKRSFSYDADIQGMPFFVREMGNSWRIQPDGDNRSIIHMHMKGRLLPVFAQVMGPFMKKQMGKSADTLLEELKYFAENDRVHPRKAEQISKLRRN